MPLFEYRCNDCNQPFEELVTSDDQAVNCPNCKGHSFTKQLSVFAASTGNGLSSDLPCGRPKCDSGFT
ncbi:MAG: zinc ribbon domain-containing protein [Candidatus Zixiibacteriota bacterium]